MFNHSDTLRMENPDQDPRSPGVGFWNARTKVERCLILAMTGIVFTATLLAFGLASFISRTPNSANVIQDMPIAQALLATKSEVLIPQETNDINDVCLTRGCVKAAAALIERLNDDVDPCDDFFEFSCGNFVKKTIIPDDKSSVSMFSLVGDKLTEKLRILVQQPVMDNDSKATTMVKNLFKSCMNTTRIEEIGLDPITAILKDMGGWPVLMGNSWNESSFSWIESNYINRKIGYSVDYFFDFSVTIDVRNSTSRMIWIDQPGLGMSREYLMKGLNDTDVQAYYKYSVDVAKLLGADPKTAERHMLEVLNFQIAIANISLPREQRRNMTKLYNVMSLNELEAKIPEIPWFTYFNTLLPNVSEVRLDERVGVSDITYFQNFTKIMKNTPKRTIANYLMWRVVASSVSYLSDDIRDIQLAYSKILTGKSERPRRWKECMGLVGGKLSYGMGNLYVKNFFNIDAKAQADELVIYVRQEFDRILNTIDWMDEKTRQQALNKAAAIKAHIAYPKELLMDEKLSEHYGDLAVDDGALLDNMRTIGIFGTNYSFRRLREKVDKLDWKRQASVAVVNAYYSSIENSIKFPAGILQGIFFEPDRPKYMNFGGVGFVIGHEITHGFDDQGKQFDADGNLKNWWEKSTEQKFLKKAKCIIEQYGNYTAPENNMTVNGINTQGENIADNGGVKEAYNAYKQWVVDNGPEKSLPGLSYNPKQLFWVTAAQVWCSKHRPEALKIRILTGAHSPGRFRVVGAFSNSKEFATDWNCPIGSKMNPVDKCHVW